jgi:hypothetical protein
LQWSKREVEIRAWVSRTDRQPNGFQNVSGYGKAVLLTTAQAADDLIAGVQSPAAGLAGTEFGS